MPERPGCARSAKSGVISRGKPEAAVFCLPATAMRILKSSAGIEIETVIQLDRRLARDSSLQNLLN